MRRRWLVLALPFIVGLLLGFGISAIADPRLAGLYERLASAGLLGRMAIVLLVFAISVAYGAFMIAGVTQLARPSGRVTAAERLHHLPGSESMQRILVATGGGPHAQLGLQLAAKVASGGEGELTLFRVVPPSEESRAEVEEQALRQVAEQTLGQDSEVQTRVVASSSVVDAILDETRMLQYDLLVVGTSDEGMVRSLLFGTIPDAVAARTSCSMLIVRAAMA
jgi:nucleotide-binding universal stress UspA family protein